MLVNDMVESCRKILQYCGDMTFAEFQSDPKTIDAVNRNFEIIG
jgi:uncharacterized protein with HEPN domain